VSRNIRILLIAVVALLAAGGYWKLALGPKRAQAAQLAKQVATERGKLAQQQSLLATYRGAQAQYKSNYATVVRLGKAVPADDDTRSLVVQLDAAAKRSGTNFANIDIASTASSSSTASASATPVAPGAVSVGSYSALPLSLAFTGDFDTLESFLGRVQRFVTLNGDRILVNGRLMRVESISLQPGTDGWPHMAVKIGADSYIVPDDQAPPAPSSSTTTTTTTTTAKTADKPGSPLR
jgi:Tfp pilus assembly protein PilO